MTRLKKSCLQIHFTAKKRLQFHGFATKNRKSTTNKSCCSWPASSALGFQWLKSSNVLQMHFDWPTSTRVQYFWSLWRNHRMGEAELLLHVHVRTYKTIVVVLFLSQIVFRPRPIYLAVHKVVYKYYAVVYSVRWDCRTSIYPSRNRWTSTDEEALQWSVQGWELQRLRLFSLRAKSRHSLTQSHSATVSHLQARKVKVCCSDFKHRILYNNNNNNFWLIPFLCHTANFYDGQAHGYNIIIL